MTIARKITTKKASLAPHNDNYQDVLAAAINVFGNETAALKWLSRKIPALNNEIPLEMILTPKGKIGVIECLGHIEYGNFA